MCVGSHVRHCEKKPSEEKNAVAGDERIRDGIALPLLILHPYCPTAMVLVGCTPHPFKVRLTPQRGEGV